MTAQERLAAAHDRWMSDFSLPSLFVDALLDGIDPTLAQDIEDGAELRLLERDGWATGVQLACHARKGWMWLAWANNRPAQLTDPTVQMSSVEAWGGTKAAAARACREALEARKGPEGGA